MRRDQARYDGYRAVLLAEAERLTGASKLPVRIGALCSELGVPVIRSSSIRKNKALLVLKDDASFEIRLPPRPTGRELPSPLERLQVAHEIAHLILYQRFSVAPGDRREYWKHETLADEFATTLLLPSSAIPVIEAGPDMAARHALREVRRIAQTGGTPASAAAQRFCALNARVMIFGIAQHKERGIVRFSTLPHRGKMGTVLPQQDPLVGLLHDQGVARRGAVPIGMGATSLLVAAHSEAAAYAQWVEGVLLVAIASATVAPATPLAPAADAHVPSARTKKRRGS